MVNGINVYLNAITSKIYLGQNIPANPARNPKEGDGNTVYIQPPGSPFLQVRDSQILWCAKKIAKDHRSFYFIHSWGPPEERGHLTLEISSSMDTFEYGCTTENQAHIKQLKTVILLKCHVEVGHFSQGISHYVIFSGY